MASSFVRARASIGSAPEKRKKKGLFAKVLLNLDNEEEVQFSSESGSDDNEQRIFSESSDSNNDSISMCRQWTPIDAKSPPPAPPRFVFMTAPSIKVPVTEDGNCAWYFELFLTSEITDFILHEINCYAEQFLARRNLSHVFQKKLTAEELNMFLAIIILQRIIPKPEISIYVLVKESDPSDANFQ